MIMTDREQKNHAQVIGIINQPPSFFVFYMTMFLYVLTSCVLCVVLFSFHSEPSIIKRRHLNR